MKSFAFLTIAIVIFGILILSGCSQQENLPVETTMTDPDNSVLLKQYNLPRAIMMELQQAKIATARYNNIENAFADGYKDIGVVVPGMGHHFMKEELVNETFEIEKPEILVYSPHPVTGNMRLVAVEYAVPNTFPEPDGFTGDYDEWDNNTTFGLWLLHAWVWEYNPDGVFTPMNPNVH